MNVLVIHATAGAGHKKAAEAIAHGFQAKSSHRVTLVDALDYTNPIFQYTYPNCYAFIVSRLPWVWAICFGVLDWPMMQPFVRIARRIYNGLNAGKLARFLIKEQFDCIICTQFLSAEVSAYLKRTNQIRSKVVCVVTDYDVHRIWINRGIDAYACACEYTQKKLIELGVPNESIVVSGIPTDAKFCIEYNVHDLRRELGLKSEIPTILIATGSFGFGPIEELVDLLIGHQMIVVCGHNKELFERLSNKNLKDVKVCGLVDNMHQLMSVADVMVTKPGGLSISEALVKGLVMIFFSAIPGQETNNVKVLAHFKVGIGPLALEKIAQEVNRLCSQKDELNAKRQQAKSIGKPSAVNSIVELVERLCR